MGEARLGLGNGTPRRAGDLVGESLEASCNVVIDAAGDRPWEGLDLALVGEASSSML